MALALPDSTARKSRTVDLNKIVILGKDGALQSVEAQKFKANISDIPWRFDVKSSSVEDGLRMKITCLGSPYKKWKLTVSRLLVKFALVSNDDESDDAKPWEITKSVDQHIFDIDNKSTEVFLPLEMIHFLIPDSHVRDFNFLKVTMTVDRREFIEMKEYYCTRYDFCKRTENSTMVVDVGSQRFYVNLEYLAQVSEYFSALRRNTSMVPKDDESDLWLLKLDDVDSREFEQFLHLLYPPNLDIELNYKNIEAMVKLADRFQCGRAQFVCAKNMYRMKKISAAKLIAICEKYNLEWNVEKILKKLSVERLQKISKEPEFQNFSMKTMKMIVTRLSKYLDCGTGGSSSETSGSSSESYASGSSRTAVEFSDDDSVASDVIG